MNFPMSIYVLFGIFGSLGAILFIILTMKNMKLYSKENDKRMKKNILIQQIGFIIVFSAQWFVCGIGGPPGNLLSLNIESHNHFFAMMAAIATISLSVLGWLILIFAARIREKK